MTSMTNFEDIFNKLITRFKGLTINVSLKQNGLRMASFSFSPDSIKIKPLNKRNDNFGKQTVHNDKLTKNKKIGLIIFYEKQQEKLQKKLQIPFILGFNTMEATFSSKGATINSLGINIIIQNTKKNHTKHRQKGA